MTNLIISLVMILSCTINDTDTKLNRKTNKELSITNFEEINSNLIPQSQIKSHLS